MFGLAKAKNQPNFSMQWRNGGDFLSGFLKKYYLTIAWRKASLIIEESKLDKKVGQTQLYQGVV
ncbi:hypothetical protein ACS2MN_30770 [Bacillus cereus group sp. BceL062]|uniref:hypothetical protein n=1 Tax=Bacillus cereus group sp. BceL062 TaxID=3445166 RepID=UPI003F240CBE